MPHLKRIWCIGQITGEYLARMEDLLHLYGLPYDDKRPLVCFDELPVQPLGDVVAPLGTKPGKPRREDYEYERGGVAVLLVAFEPLAVLGHTGAGGAEPPLRKCEVALS